MKLTLARRLAVTMITLSMIGPGVVLPAAQAAMVGVEAVVAETPLVAADQARQRINGVMAREGVAERLAAEGVSAEEVRQRVAALSDAEVQELAARFDELPAGGDFLGIAALIFIVFIITDAIGATDIFTFVDPIR